MQDERHSVRRLGPDDAWAFFEIRVEALARSPRAFGATPADETALAPDARLRRLRDNYIVGGFVDGALSGVAGFERLRGVKLAHKGWLWGMYVREAARGSGLADAIVAAILDHARRSQVELVLLAVADGNPRARRFYERCGFVAYGVEPGGIKLGANDYLDQILMAKRP